MQARGRILLQRMPETEMTGTIHPAHGTPLEQIREQLSRNTGIVLAPGESGFRVQRVWETLCCSELVPPGLKTPAEKELAARLDAFSLCPTREVVSRCKADGLEPLF